MESIIMGEAARARGLRCDACQGSTAIACAPRLATHARSLAECDKFTLKGHWDRWGFSWQITPKLLLDLTTSSDRDKAKRAFEAMLTMHKIDVAAIEAAAKGA